MNHELDRLTTEYAHILFMDIVGYSLLPTIDDQTQAVATLQNVVRNTMEFQRAQARGNLISLDTGDGLALVFFRDPTAPVQCAAELARALNDHPEVRLRMGINSGLVSRTKDINGNENVYGDGINMAQRVMNCGEAGHILLSQTCADVMRQFSSWAGSLYDLGEYEIKHDRTMRLFNLCMEQVGNPAPPRVARVSAQPAKPQANVPAASTAPANTSPALVPTSKTETPAPVVPAVPTIPTASTLTSAAHSAASATPPAATPAPGNVAAQALKITLIYKRNAPDDEYVRALLETALKPEHDLFIDRQLKIGVQWAEEIEQRIRSSDVVIALISEASAQSEMVEFELQTAQNEAQKQAVNGLPARPRLLPVYIKISTPLPDAIASFVESLHHASWKSPADDAALTDAMRNALRAPEPPAPPAPVSQLEAVGGAVPLDSAFYLVRRTDEEFTTAVRRHDSIVLVKGARQMGKTSLLARGLQQAREMGALCIRTDFQKLNTAHLVSADTLFLTLAEMIADQLDLDTLPEDVWNAKRGPNVNFERYLRREVLAKSDKPVVWAMDEVDRLFTCDFGSEVFGLFRSWHNERSLDPTGPWGKLTLAIAYATEAHLFITDLNQSPFNVGTRLTLQDFTLEQAEELNRRYGQPLRNAQEVQALYDLVGGQPYLLRCALDQLVSKELDIETLRTQSAQDDGPFGDHLRRLLVSLSQDDMLMDVVRNLLRGNPCTSHISFYRLRAAGLLGGTTPQDAHLRCRLYATYLERHLI